MYLYCWIFLGIMISLMVLDVVLGVPQIVSQVRSLAVTLVIGFLGNSWYKRHVENKIKAITASAAGLEEVKAKLAQQGGTSGWAVLGFTIIFAAIIIGFILVSSLTGYVYQ